MCLQTLVAQASPGSRRWITTQLSFSLLTDPPKSIVQIYSCRGDRAAFQRRPTKMLVSLVPLPIMPCTFEGEYHTVWYLVGLQKTRRNIPATSMDLSRLLRRIHL